MIKGKFLPLFNVILLVTLLFSAMYVVGLGAANITVKDSYRIIYSHLAGLESGYLKSLESIVLHYRLPRILMAILVGSGLSIAGAIMQSVVHNPIATPYIMGISSGGYVGAVLYFIFAPLLFTSTVGLMFMSIMGSMVTCLLVLYVSKKTADMSTVTLILIGSVMNVMFLSVGNFLMSLFGTFESITNITFWTMGSLTKATWPNVAMVFVVVLMGGIFSIIHGKNLDILMQGDEVAVTLGLEVEKLRYLYLFVISVMTGFIVATCGIIAFVGLIVPHLCRILVGTSHRRLLPVVSLVGALLLVWSDALARSMVANAEIPIGIITSLIGGPLFAILMLKKGYHRS